MKTTRELYSMLHTEICNSLDTIVDETKLECYNEILGDTSFLLVGILQNELEKNSKWDSMIWLDDSLIHKVQVDGRKLKLWGVVIWGKEGTTQQWTDPFFCEFFINCEQKELKKMIFFFGDNKSEEVTYEQFAANRFIWDEDYYSSDRWNPSERSWMFVIQCDDDVSTGNLQ